MTFITDQIKSIAQIDILKLGREQNCFIGRPFYIDYNRVLVMTCDAWKSKVNGIPQGAFLLAFYDGETDVEEALLLRAIAPTKLPTDDDNIKSMVAYYKENMEIAGLAGGSSNQSQLDQFTRYEFSFSGLECSILGVFYRVNEKNQKGGVSQKTEFGADLENFYSANNYKVYKATDKVLQVIVNQRDGDEIAGNESEFKIGDVRYSSSRRFQKGLERVPVWISPKDFLGKRTALFGMTRTGKSNTVKKIIEATVEISSKAKENLGNDIAAIKRIREERKNNPSQPQLLQKEQAFIKKLTTTFDDASPKYPVGQIIFDINGEYANANMQDEGTAIFEIYKNKVVRYSVLEKEDFKVLKVNFYKEIESGFDLIKSSFSEEKSDYIKSFTAVDLITPENYHSPIDKKTSDEKTATYLYDRKKALYQCCLYKAKFAVPSSSSRVRFNGCAKTINTLVPTVKPHDGISFDEAVDWFSTIYEASGNIDPQDTSNPFNQYKSNKGHDFLDEDMKAMLVFLTRKSKPSGVATLSGYRKLRSLIDLHTAVSDKSFEIEILQAIREGKIVIVDLSQGNPQIQQLYSQRICKKIFDDSMNRFIHTHPNNFVQFYFEEAHNLFPKKDDKDLSDVYNRIAKEGAKLNLGMIYATQEVSSISSNILKNTQNWFIAHLNNEDELREIKKYYDFSDFISSLVRFSANNDKGFVRMKTYTNPFVVPVQIDRFLANKT